MTDLTLVPIEDLIKEICVRTNNFVIGYTQPSAGGGDYLHVDSHGDSYLTALGLCDEIKELIIFKTRPANNKKGDGDE